MRRDTEHEETIHLCFGQRIRAFLLERVLRGQHHEQVQQLVRLAGNGDLPLFHGFQERRLYLEDKTSLTPRSPAFAGFEFDPWRPNWYLQGLHQTIDTGLEHFIASRRRVCLKPLLYWH